MSFLARFMSRTPKSRTGVLQPGLAEALTNLQQVEAQLSTLQQLLAEVCVSHLLPREPDSKSLNICEAQVCSQSGEDGIIAEIFRRISMTNQCFVETGV